MISGFKSGSRTSESEDPFVEDAVLNHHPGTMSLTTNSQQQQQKQQIPQIYTLEQMESILESERFARELVDIVEAGFVAYSCGDFCAAPIQTLGAPPLAPFSTKRNSAEETNSAYAAQTCVKSGYMVGDDIFCIKVASGGYPLPTNSGLLQIYSQKTGRLETLLLDDGLLTEHRTAAAGAVAARHCLLRRNNNDNNNTRNSMSKIGILGTGVQARFQLRYLKYVVSEHCRDVLVWGRTLEHAVQFQTDMQEQGWRIELASQPSDLWRKCDLIVTTTSAREPILSAPLDSTTKDEEEGPPQPGGRSSRRRRHITCIGADAPGKMELSVDLVAMADLCVADSRLQTVERGEFQSAIAQGLIERDRVVELGELILDERKAEMVPKDGLTIFDSSGVAVQDCAAAKVMLRCLREREVNSTT